MRESAETRAKTISKLNELGLRAPTHLPLLEERSELSPPDDRVIVSRAVVLTYIVGIGLSGEIAKIREAVQIYGLSSDLSNRESELLEGHISEQDRVDCSWLTEALQAFGWALNLVTINVGKLCDEDLASAYPRPFTDPSLFISEARVRPFWELYEMADLHYLLHWIARDEQRQDLSSIQEKRRSLDWMIGVEEDWDLVPLDT